MGNNVHLSIVIPVYMAENIVDELIRRLNTELIRITNDYEIILVEDRSTDNSWNKIANHCAKDLRIKGIRLSKNFGQHHAIAAGLVRSGGDWVVVMDCDLQDRPEEIIKLYETTKQGYDIVFARRGQRQDKFLKKQTSSLFFKLFSYLSGIKQDGTIGNFGIYSKKTVNVINNIGEPITAFSPMMRWIGFNKTTVEVQHANRFEGKSTYNWNKLINLALNIAISYSEKPLKLVIQLGLSISVLSILYTIYNVIAYYLGIIKVSGYTSLIISIWFLSGLIILILGIVGLYVGKTFEGVKNRPRYIEDEVINS